jgi:segregation and condensation protein A
VSPEQVVVDVVYGQQVLEEPVPPAADVPVESDPSGFQVRLDNFTGPFDLLLQLIGKHKLDVTEIALHTVTDDFIAYIRAMGDDWDLGETSEFLLVAATLLDLKAARLLPAAEVEDEEDLALLEARDLLFARLLQYKAYKEAAAVIADLEGTGARRWPRAVSMEPRYAEALPDLVLGIGAERLFKLALKQFAPKPGPPEVSIAHIHQVRVSVREHAELLRDRLRRAGSATFSLLVADCENTLEVVARFLALLELYRQDLIDFAQPIALEEMTVHWIGGADPDAELNVDDYEGSPPEPDTAATEPVAVEDGEDDGVARVDPDSDDDEGPRFARVDLDPDDLDDDADLDDIVVPEVDFGESRFGTGRETGSPFDADDADLDAESPDDQGLNAAGSGAGGLDVPDLGAGRWADLDLSTAGSGAGGLDDPGPGAGRSDADPDLNAAGVSVGDLGGAGSGDPGTGEPAVGAGGAVDLAPDPDDLDGDEDGSVVEERS